MRTFGSAVAAAALLLAPLAAQTGSSAWVAWARANHHPIAAVQTSEGDTFNDLQFFKTVLKDRRLVQLGESGHGVAEFNHAKVRLIKFLHQQMGYDVIAFESGLFECYNANANPAASASALALMRNCIFAVWHTSEVLPLFEYIRETQSTSRPLILAGFDTQMSSSLGASARPMFFANMVRTVDAERAVTVATRDQEFMIGVFNRGASYATANKDRLSEFYGGLERFFEEHRASLQERFGADAPIVAQRAAWSMLRYMEQLRASTQQIADRYEGSGAIRDFGMANNLTFLANELYPGRKILVWAHNGHIRHDNAGEHERALPTMGQWIRERFRDQLYTIGLYMDRGAAAQNNRVVYAINPAPAGSMEWIMANSGSPALFMDFLHQQRQEGNSWMFQRTPQREWGMDPPFLMVPRNQYDGVLFIDAVKAPSYIQ